MSTKIDLHGARVLIVDDDPANLDVLLPGLEEAGYDIMVATGGERALEIARKTRPDVVLLDVIMPGMDGFEVCRRLRDDAITADIPVLFLTASDGEDGVLEGFAAGGLDYVLKPFRQGEVLARLRTHLERSRLARSLQERNAELVSRSEELTRANAALGRANEQLRAEIDRRVQLTDERDLLADRVHLLSEREAEHWGVAGIVGRSPILHKILEDVRLLQGSEVSVLITGESGTGKELIARALHDSTRADGPFVPVNCASVPRDLVESLFFGHRRGAFSGARQDQHGYFELAHGGTLFLDEVGDMPLDLQGKLLRVLEDGVVLPLGAREPRAVDARVLSATNSDLSQAIGEGRFRQDLYYRLARFTVEVPPLRQRKADIPQLAEHFVALLSGEMGLPRPPLATAAIEALAAHDFPGNVRELKNLVERALLESRGAEIAPEHLHFGPRTPGPATAARAAGQEDPTCLAHELPLNLEQAQVALARRALKKASGNMTEAARLLGINRTKLYRILAVED